MTAADDRAATPAEAARHAPLVLAVPLGPGVDGWFTGRPPAAVTPAVGVAGNLSHRRPHEPARLAADRRAAFERMGLDTRDVVWMQQVHGADVAVVDAGTPRGAEVRGVDALVTAEADRPLAVQVADCVPVLLASPAAGVVAVAHAGRRGVELGVVPATLAAMADLGAAAASISAAIGPAIGGCCYEVPSEMREDLSDDHPVASGTTTWGTPSLDLAAAVAEVLRSAGVGDVRRTGGCTRCDADDRWFSHRADPDTGRQVGIVVRRGDGA